MISWQAPVGTGYSAIPILALQYQNGQGNVPLSLSAVTVSTPLSGTVIETTGGAGTPFTFPLGQETTSAGGGGG